MYYSGVKYTSLFLLIVGFTLIMAACGDTDITVEGDVSITEATLETTAQATPTPTSVPPTPALSQAIPATTTPVVTRTATVQVAAVPAIITQTPTPEGKPTPVPTQTPMPIATVTPAPAIPTLSEAIPATTTPVATRAAIVQVATVPAITTQTPTPEGKPTPAPTQTSMPTATATPVPTSSPIPSSTAVPTFTATPTSISDPIIKPTPLPNIFDEFGFTLVLDEDASFSSSNLTISGMRKDAADGQQGLLTFEYNGADIAFFWLPTTDDTPATVVESTYQLLRDSQPANILIPVSEGDISIDHEPGKFGGFVATDSSGENAGGGLIAAWTCQKLGITLSLIATGPDATTLQIRFDRLISGFKCN